jgi:hypothetical protein
MSTTGSFFEEPVEEDEEGEPELAVPERPLQAKSTEPGANKFRIRLFLRVMGNRTLRPVAKKQYAHYVVNLICEYPKYEEEINAKRENTSYDEYHSLRYIDIDSLSEWRVRRCLRSWDFHKVIPEFTKKLVRENNLLSEDSMMVYRKLPPLVRKDIANRIWSALGDP